MTREMPRPSRLASQAPTPLLTLLRHPVARHHSRWRRSSTRRAEHEGTTLLLREAVTLLAEWAGVRTFASFLIYLSPFWLLGRRSKFQMKLRCVKSE